MKWLLGLFACVICTGAWAEARVVYAEDAQSTRIAIATVTIAEDGTYGIVMNNDAFADHFLSMRPFKCIEGPDKHWCHVPYPYAIQRDISVELTDLEYDLMFVWKGSKEYGINMWNGVYYRISEQDGVLTGELYEMDMDLLAVPPAEGVLRPLGAKDVHKSDPDSHWLPRLVIE